MFTTAEAEACDRLLVLALEEDLGVSGDLTSQAVIPPELQGRAVFVARSSGIIAGLPIIERVLNKVGAGGVVELLVKDGDAVSAGTRLAVVGGPMRLLLTAERTALNFLQRLSGVATRTRQFVDVVRDTRARIYDTRKTTPGWRRLEKYAVRCGGGKNHRVGLYDGVLIKDNHLAALAGEPQAITRAVELARKFVERLLPVEVEVDNLTQLDEALACKPTIILLDNMSPELLAEAVRRRDAVAPRVQLEASGGVTLATVAAIAATGVERISTGNLTHSAPALDIALDYEA